LSKVICKKVDDLEGEVIGANAKLEHHEERLKQITIANCITVLAIVIK
jgi:hypothetical protein